MNKNMFRIAADAFCLFTGYKKFITYTDSTCKIHFYDSPMYKTFDACIIRTDYLPDICEIILEQFLERAMGEDLWNIGE